MTVLVLSLLTVMCFPAMIIVLARGLNAPFGLFEGMFAQAYAAFGAAIRAGFEAQIAMFPNMMNPTVARLIEKYRHRALGWKLSGAGGGGYLILVADQPIAKATRIVARRDND